MLDQNIKSAAREAAPGNTVDSLYLEHPLSRTSLYLELKSRSLCVGCNLFFSLYLELSLSRTNFLVPSEFEIEIQLYFLQINFFLEIFFPKISSQNMKFIGKIQLTLSISNSQGTRKFVRDRESSR